MNRGGACNGNDLDELGYFGIDNGDLTYDLNADGHVDLKDRDAWLSQVGILDVYYSGYLRGDANFNGSVDSSDLMTLALHWQQGGISSWTNGDFNFDGIVDAADLNLLAKNWQKQIEASPNLPEPTNFLLLVVGIAMITKVLRTPKCRALIDR